MKNIQMVDLVSQYNNIKKEVNQAIEEVMSSAMFIKGPKVVSFEQNLCEYLNVKHTISCANGTDALQIALMALDLKPGDEVIVPAFTYVATAEVIGLLGFTPVMVDVCPDTFNTTAEIIEKAITPKTKVIVPVHLYGQSSDMEDIMNIAAKYNLYVIEDNAQAIGADYTFRDGSVKKTGTIGHIGCTSFFPSKNLGCYGDGGAIFTNSDELGAKIKMIANHGQAKKYHHAVIGVNSRLDAIQAVILDIKLGKLDKYSKARQSVAAAYDQAFKDITEIQTPVRQSNSTHVFHQYTMKIGNGKRDALKEYLAQNNVPSMVYYPIPLYKQEAFSNYYDGEELAVTEELCASVISLPIHTEMDSEIQHYIINTVVNFFKK
jgi:dTDP-4-amino-4,6-dideoxygalactose transaminase